MKKLLLLIFVVLGVGLTNDLSGNVEPVRQAPTFDDAVAIIKQFEGLHSSRHWPLVGYGHKVQPGEKFSRSRALSEKEADALLRKDLAKFCSLYRDYGADSLLLGALAYNCGPGIVNRSSVLSKLKAGNRDIEAAYLAHSKYRGKTLSQLKKRRETELAALYVKHPTLAQEESLLMQAAEEIQNAERQAVAIENNILETKDVK